MNSVLRAARSSLDKSFKVTASVISASTSAAGAVVVLLVAGSAVTSSVGLAFAAIFFLVRCISVGAATSSVTRGLLPVGVTSSSCASGVPFKNPHS